MQLAELSKRSEVSIPSIKYYVREGLLSPGERSGRGRAMYSDAHLERLRLIRALVDAGGLTLARVRKVIETLEQQPDSLHKVFGAAAAEVADDGEVDLARARGLVDRLGWRVSSRSSAMLGLADGLAGLELARFDLTDEYLVQVARELEALATLEVESVPTATPSMALRYVVLGTTLMRPVILALRELAQQDVSARMFGPGARDRTAK